MVRVRKRAATALTITVAAAMMSATLVTAGSAPAADSPAMLGATPLFMTERFTADGGPGRSVKTGDVAPERLVAMRGEREGFQLVLQNTSGASLELGARVTGIDQGLEAAQAGSSIDFEVLRVGLVKVPQGSTGLGTKAGMYTDPLPPFRNENPGGRLTIPDGQWGGLAVIAKVRTDAPAGSYTGNVELFTGSGDREVVMSRQPFTLDVRDLTLMQPGTKKSFKTVLNVEAEAYWLQHDHLRNGMNRPFFLPANADRMAQVGGLFAFMDERNLTPLEMPFGNPSREGTYNCSFGFRGGAPARSYLGQLTGSYFGRTRDIDPSAKQFPSRFMSSHSPGCDIDSTKDDFEGTIDKLRTPSVKQDDFFNPQSTSVFRKIAGAWSSGGMFNESTYVKSPFDEPGDSDARQRATMNNEVPKANTAIHQAVGKKAKVVLASWPRDTRSTRICPKVMGGKRGCTTLTGDAYGNTQLWDGKGSDDVDVWMPSFSRLYGRTLPMDIQKEYGVNREREYADRLERLRKKGKETWAYNFYTATKTMPQVVIDAPGTDARLQYLMLARDGHTGLFVSNLMIGWAKEPGNHERSSLRRKGNPYEEAPYFKHQVYGVAAGWGTFIYPGYAPSLGLIGEDARNSERGRPVTSLRVEGMRDGGEDANLMAMYRDRFGDAKLQQKIKTVFPGKSIEYPKSLGNVVGPYYDNGNDLAGRMEAFRRGMITDLTS